PTTGHSAWARVQVSRVPSDISGTSSSAVTVPDTAASTASYQHGTLLDQPPSITRMAADVSRLRDDGTRATGPGLPFVVLPQGSKSQEGSQLDDVDGGSPGGPLMVDWKTGCAAPTDGKMRHRLGH